LLRLASSAANHLGIADKFPHAGFGPPVFENRRTVRIRTRRRHSNCETFGTSRGGSAIKEGAVC
jgi:hypothetical protein